MLTVIVLASAPSGAPARSHSHSHVPSCLHLSRGALASLAQTGRLDFRKKVGNLCDFTGAGEHKGHYHTTFDVDVIPYFKSVWDTAKSKAQALAAKHGDDFGENSRKLFFVSGQFTGKGKCNKHNDQPGKGEARFGPACAGEPDAEHFGVYGYGKDKRNGLELMVTAGLTGQRGDVHLSHMIELAKEVISGKIH